MKTERVCGDTGKPFRSRQLDRALPVAALLLAGVLAASPVDAQSASPGERPAEQFSFMQLLTDHELHNIDDESRNAYGQFTYISGWKLRFPALYTDANGSINSLRTSRGRVSRTMRR
jgi:hypothetical protein